MTIKGAHGYRDRLYFDGISIHYNGRDDMGVWCEMSGQGCRVFETYGHGDYMKLFEELLYHGRQEVHFTRIDIAFDDHDKILDMKRLFADTMAENFISRFGSYVYHGGSKGMSVEHGRKGSRTMIRIYDKAAERGLDDGSHWIRVELQLRDERAEAFAQKIAANGSKAIGDVFLGVVYNYLRYVVPDESDSNRRRWPTVDYWERFIDSAKRVRLFERPGTEYNLLNLEEFVIRQSGNAIQTYINILGMDELRDNLKKRGTRTSNYSQKFYFRESVSPGASGWGRRRSSMTRRRQSGATIARKLCFASS
jgi:phage replication initiation protein